MYVRFNYKEVKQLSVVRSLNPAKHIWLCIKVQCIQENNVLNNKIPINLIILHVQNREFKAGKYLWRKNKKTNQTYFLALQTSSFCYISQIKAFGTGNKMTIILFNLGLNSKFKSAPGYDLHGSHDQILSRPKSFSKYLITYIPTKFIS